MGTASLKTRGRYRFSLKKLAIATDAASYNYHLPLRQVATVTFLSVPYISNAWWKTGLFTKDIFVINCNLYIIFYLFVSILLFLLSITRYQ